jgi:diguanylate cyclase (GGDEF)-like protein
MASVTQQGVLAVLAVVHGGCLLAAPLMVSGWQLALVIGAESLASLGIAGALAERLRRGRMLPDLALVAVLVLAALGTAVRAVAVGRPWAAVDVALTLAAASAIRSERAFRACLLVVATFWLASAGFGVTGSGASRLGWLLTGIVVLAVAGLVAVLRAGVRTLEHTLAELRQNVQDQSVQDSLTGAVNRRGLEMLGLPLLENARRQGEAVHCLFIDVDGFKAVNAEAGFEFADEVLVALTESLKSSVRGTDSVARWGGDQFVVIGPGTGTSPLELERRIRARLNRLTPAPGVNWQGRVSIGSATLVPWDDGNMESLLARAEQDMRLRRSLRRQGAERGVGAGSAAGATGKPGSVGADGPTPAESAGAEPGRDES